MRTRQKIPCAPLERAAPHQGGVFPTCFTFGVYEVVLGRTLPRVNDDARVPSRSAVDEWRRTNGEQAYGTQHNTSFVT
jgi:hypothetical protein